MINILLGIYFYLCQFDLSCNLSREPLLLDGGFLRWYQTYSPYCIGKIKKKVEFFASTLSLSIHLLCNYMVVSKLLQESC